MNNSFDVDDFKLARRLKLSEFLAEREKRIEYVLETNANNQFPDPNPVWRLPDRDDYDSDQDYEEARAEHLKECQQDYDMATRPVNLGAVEIDTNMVELKIDRESRETGTFEWLTDGIDDPDPVFFLLGENHGQPGHVCVVRAKDGRVFTTIHDFNFLIQPINEGSMIIRVPKTLVDGDPT